MHPKESTSPTRSLSATYSFSMSSSVYPPRGSPSRNARRDDFPEKEPKAVAMVMSDPNECKMVDVPVDHWCGWPQPCCWGIARKPCPSAISLNHLPICHDTCWRREVIEVKKRNEEHGVKHSDYPDAEEPEGYLRLCHRRCYIQDLMRRLKYDGSGELDRTEIVPHNQTLWETFWGPSLSHWVVRWVWVPWRGNKWQTPRLDVPWPRSSLSESRILGTGQAEDRTAQAVDEEKRVGTSGEGDGCCSWFLRLRRVS